MYTLSVPEAMTGKLPCILPPTMSDNSTVRNFILFTKNKRHMKNDAMKYKCTGTYNQNRINVSND